MFKNIKHIIFDLGNVLLNIDLTAAQNAFLALGYTPQQLKQWQHKGLFEHYECGKISSEEFINTLLNDAPTPLQSHQIIEAWNSTILDFPLRRLQILQQLQLYHDLVLLSNTNALHESCFNQRLQQAHGIPNIALFFDRVYYSHKIGMRKPQKELFQKVLDECGFKPEHTLFIDDLQDNLLSAQALGIKGIWLQEPMTIENDIFKNINP